MEGNACKSDIVLLDLYCRVAVDRPRKLRMPYHSKARQPFFCLYGDKSLIRSKKHNFNVLDEESEGYLDVQSANEELNNIRQPKPPESHRHCSVIAKELEEKAKMKAAKGAAMRQRRTDFAIIRTQQILLLLDAGFPYVCVFEDCMEDEDLTVDHKIPLSRGGGDELENLQFMCRSHNSQKNDKIM